MPICLSVNGEGYHKFTERKQGKNESQSFHLLFLEQTKDSKKCNAMRDITSLSLNASHWTAWRA